MALKNFYTGKRVSGTSLIDLAGENNGTLAGATLPTINSNGYLSFVGGNGVTAGNRCRVTFSGSSFSYTYSDSYSLLIIFRSNKSDSETHQLFRISGNDGDSSGFIQFFLNNDETLYMGVRANSKLKRAYTPSVYCDGRWHFAALCYSNNNLNLYIDGYIVSLSISDEITSGNFYSNAPFPVLGAQATTGGFYNYDLTGDIAMMANFGQFLSAAEQSNYNSFYKGFF